MTPAYSVPILFPLPFERCRFQPTQKCAQTLPLCQPTSSLRPMAGFSGAFAMTLAVRLLRSCSRSSRLFEPLIPNLGLLFLIQNT